MRLGLIADTHMPGSLADLWPQAMDLLSDVDCILHAGDLHTLDIVDQLSALAPTYVSRGNGDVGLFDDRLQDTWILDFAGATVGMIHHFPSPTRKSTADIYRYVDKHFERRPEILIYGHTHLEGIHQVGDILCINPGSPTLPRNQSLRLGTIATLDILPDQIKTTLWQLNEDGVEHHSEFLPHKLERP